MSEFEILRKVEIPLAIPTLMAGIRSAAIAIVGDGDDRAIGGRATLGDFIINDNVYGEDGVLAGAIVVALLALAARVRRWRGCSAGSPRTGLKLSPA